MTKIDPIILKGTRDFSPQQKAKRDYVMQKVKDIFARFGYDSIETPILAPAETILGKYGDEGTKLTYSFETQGGTKIALPYDLTVPFARFVAANYRELPMPFKRYQIQRVWRAERPQKGRLREFYQCDIDIIGTRSLVAEAEIAKVITTVFKELGFENFKILVNSRRLLNDVLKSFNIEGEKATECIRIIDKLSKIGSENVIVLLKEQGVTKAEEIMDLLTPGDSFELTAERLSSFDLGEISEFFSRAKQFGVEEKYLKFDPSLARGLDYYTGISFEVVSEDFDFGTLCAGGRYDNLCSLFCDEDFSGVGVAFGFERIMLGLEEMQSLTDVRLNSQVLVTVFDEGSYEDSISMYNDLTAGGINCEIFFEADRVKKQLKYADKKGIPLVVVRGPEEIEKNEVAVKSLESGKQKNIPRDQMVSYLKGLTGK